MLAYSREPPGVNIISPLVVKAIHTRLVPVAGFFFSVNLIVTSSSLNTKTLLPLMDLSFTISNSQSNGLDGPNTHKKERKKGSQYSVYQSVSVQVSVQ